MPWPKPEAPTFTLKGKRALGTPPPFPPPPHSQTNCWGGEALGKGGGMKGDIVRNTQRVPLKTGVCSYFSEKKCLQQLFFSLIKTFNKI